MAEEKRCPQCGAPLAADAPQGLCPACLLKRGFATGNSAIAPSQGARTDYVPPTPAELARYFPDLEILELIGRGGMGAVYKARQKGLDRFVALKVLPFSVSRDPAFAERFAREARALARLTHPNIVTVYDFGQTDGLFYFLMEFVDGLNLRQLLNTAKISPKEALAIVPQICDALQYAHDKGIVHRDIKPENILLAKDGTVKIADFGLAKLVGLDTKDQTITGIGDVMGTPHYMAPEQVEHPQDVDHRADIYSLGVVFYQMLTGELPLGRFAPPSKRVLIDVRLDEVVLRALEKEPALRYQHASEVKTQVETIAQTEGLKIESQRTITEARFCGTAIAGACLIPLSFASVFFWDFGHLGGLQALVGVVVSTLGFVAILGTTILGWVAVWQIRRSEGRLYGMWLALTDGVLVPVLLLDILLLLGLLLTNKFINVGVLAKWYPDLEGHAFLNVPHSLIWLLFATAAVTAVDYALIRRFWRAVNKPSASSIAASSGGESVPSESQSRPTPVVTRFSITPFSQIIGAVWAVFISVTMAFIVARYSINKVFRCFSACFLIFALVASVDLFFRFYRAIKTKTTEAWNAAKSLLLINGLAVALGAFLAILLARELTSIQSNYIGRSWFPKGDSIEITSVKRSKDQMTVKGRYQLVSHDQALLALYITTRTRVVVPTDPKQHLQISNGRGEFELTHFHLVPGLPHISMYADGKSFAALYFGTKVEALEESKASWITNAPSAAAETGTVTFGPVNERIPGSEQELVAQLELALKDRDTNRIYRLFNWQGVPDDLKSSAFKSWNPVLDHLSEENARLRVWLSPLPDDNETEAVMNGIRYRPNLVPLGIIRADVTWTANGTNTGRGVGMSYGKDGSGYRIVGTTAERIYEPKTKEKSYFVHIQGDVFTGECVYVQNGTRITKTINGTGASEKVFAGDYLESCIVQKISGTRSIHLVIYENGNKIFESPEVQTNDSVIYNGTTQSSAVSFGPVIEEVLPAPSGRVAELLDLDTGQRATSTNFGANDRETHTWIRENHLDVLGVVEKGQIAVLCMDMAVVPTTSNRWDTITPSDVVTNWGLNQQEPKPITGISPVTDNTDTWLFRTREGGMGVLQILGENADPHSVKIRYTLVEATNASAEDAGQTVAGLSPVVVSTEPVSGAHDVEPGVAEIRVRFSKQMTDGSWSWSTAWGDSTPESLGTPYYLADHRTCVMKVRLEPGRTYGWWLNSEKFRNFTDRAGRPAVPYLLTFATKPN